MELLMPQLSLQYEYASTYGLTSDPWADYGCLLMSVESHHFAGRGRFSAVRWQEVREFSERLLTFPITKAAPVAAQWGHGSQDGDNLVLWIQITPTDLRGGLIVRCEVADEADETDETRQRVRTWFRTSYAELDTFRQSITVMLNRKADIAVLTGH